MIFGIVFIASITGIITYTDEAMTFYRRYDEQITKCLDSNYKSFLNRFKQKKEIKIKDTKIELINF
jgi:hypothetical protein